MSFDAYTVAVKLKLLNEVSPALVGLAGQFQGLNTHVKSLETSLLRLKQTGLIGGAMAAAGGIGLSLFRAPLEEAKKFQTEVARFSSLGLGDKVTQDAVKFAKGMDIMGSSARDNLKLLKEATTITGSFEHAKEVAPLLARMKFGLASVMGNEHAGSFERMFQDALKVTELRGALVNRQTGQIDPAQFSRVLNMMTQAYVASGGLVKPQDYLAAIKTGGVSTKLMNDESFFFGLGHFMQESGGSRTGTSSASMFQNWAMGRMPQQVAENMAKLHLLDPSHIHYGTTGHITKVDPMSMIQAKAFTDNPFKWVNEVAVPLLEKQGFHGNSLNIKLASLLGIRTASNLVDQMVREEKVANIYIERAKRASGIGGLYSDGGKLLNGQEIDLEAKWADVLRELGTAILPLAIKSVEGLTSALKGITNFIQEWPRLTQWLTVGFGVLAGIVAVGGVMAMATAAFKALGLVLAFPGVGGVGGAVGIRGIAAAIGSATAGGTLLFGLAALGLTVGALALTLNQFKNEDVDAKNHPGMRFRHTGHGGHWEIDPTLPQEHTGMHWKSLGRAGGYWEPDVASVKPRESTTPIQVTTHLNIDGKKLAENTSMHQARAASRPTAGITSFDGSMHPRPVGAGGN